MKYGWEIILLWENCAKVLYKKSDEVLAPYLSALLEWLEDLTWPGAVIILERLKKYRDMEKLVFALKECVTRAYITEEKMWLVHMSELLSYEQLVKKLPEVVVKILRNARDENLK